MSNEIDKKLFEQIFDHTLIKLADKLINTTNIQPQQRADLNYTINLSLDFNETI